jgi:hypothetical protein
LICVKWVDGGQKKGLFQRETSENVAGYDNKQYLCTRKRNTPFQDDFLMFKERKENEKDNAKNGEGYQE